MSLLTAKEENKEKLFKLQLKTKLHPNDLKEFSKFLLKKERLAKEVKILDIKREDERVIMVLKAKNDEQKDILIEKLKERGLIEPPYVIKKLLEGIKLFEIYVK